MLRIAICDDDKILVTQIEEMLNRYLDKKMIDRYIEIFYDGASLERIYEKGDRFDIIYLDIEMSGKNGIEAAKSIRRLDRDGHLISMKSDLTRYGLGLALIEKSVNKYNGLLNFDIDEENFTLTVLLYS